MSSNYNVRVWVQILILFTISLLIIISIITSCQSIPKQDTIGVNPIVSSPTIPQGDMLEKINPITAKVVPKNDEQDSLKVTTSVNYTQLSDKDIEKIILDSIPGSFIPVTDDNGRIKIIYSDLDQNGYKDAFLLIIKNRENLDAGFSNLSDVSHLLKNSRDPVDFLLSVFFQLKGNMVSMFRIPIGSSVVIDNFEVVPIKHGSDLPLGINISFQTLKGTDWKWIIFSSYNKFSLFSVEGNISTYSNSYDIDGDNIIDIVNWEYGFEEGTGYETYLTWYRWNGREYREYLSTNIVRNLNNFLEQSGLHLSFEQIDAFFSYSLNSNDFIRYKNSEKNYSNWYMKIFHPVSGSDTENNEFENCIKFQSIIFPTIFENPFSPDKKALNIFNINVKFICSNEFSFIRTASVKMNQNPFNKPQFSFYID